MFLAIKTAQDEVSHELETCNAKIPASYEDLDWGEPAQGRGSEIEPKCLILISNLELSLAKAGRNRGFL